MSPQARLVEFDNKKEAVPRRSQDNSATEPEKIQQSRPRANGGTSMNISESGAALKKLSFSFFALALCGSVMLAGALAISSPAAAEAMQIKVGTQPYPGMASVLVGIKKGFFEEAGIKVIEQRMNSGRLTMDALLAGSIDIATPVETRGDVCDFEWDRTRDCGSDFDQSG
jgi:hypothetical protein